MPGVSVWALFLYSICISSVGVGCETRIRKQPMRVLCLEPYYSGSHKAFIDCWSERSGHEWTLVTLPGYKWKWRMRHAAITFADEVAALVERGEKWDVIFCSDMLNLAEFLGLAGKTISELPTVAYFHENQLTYPVRFESERDYQFAVTNMTTALAADGVWFNSAFHRDSFLEALRVFLAKMPDCQPFESVERIAAKAGIYPQGIERIERCKKRKAGPIRILWVARWEHDKNPEDFFEALKTLENRGVEFRISVIGEQFREAPAVFEWAKDYFKDRIDRWGYQQGRDEYVQTLVDADVVVSTARHEFFGVSIVEAIAAGAYPVLPNRLAYPEILALGEDGGREEFFYDGTAAMLAERITDLASRLKDGALMNNDPARAARLVERFEWANLAPILDDAIANVEAKKMGRL